MANKKIIIDLEDLKEEPRSQAPRVFPGLSADGLQSMNHDLSGGKGKKNVVSLVTEGSTLLRGVGGLIGGAFAWIVSEVLFNQDSPSSSTIEAVMMTMFWFGLVGSFISGAIRASEDIYVGRNESAVPTFFYGAFAGLLSGLASGFIAQILYSILGGGDAGNIIVQILARTSAFAVAGTLLGFGISISSGLNTKIKAATIGGAIGGITGGLLFDTLGSFIAIIIGGGGEVSRLIGLLATGFSIGVGMAATENAYKNVWLQVIGGPFKGKQFILFKQSNIIGRHPKSDIVLAKDPLVADQHCFLIATPNGYRLQANVSSGAPTYVNQRIVTDHNLRPEDVIQVGNSFFQFKATGKK